MLSWWDTIGSASDAASFNKRCKVNLLFLFASSGLLSALAVHGGEEKQHNIKVVGVVGGDSSLLMLRPGGNHAVALIAAVIFGRYGGLSCSSCVEVFRALRRSSTARCVQVVRPRRFRAGWRQWFFPGGESSRWFLVNLGVACTWRSPAISGVASQAPHCFSFFCAGVLFVN